jgi:hypothetical protein
MHKYKIILKKINYSHKSSLLCEMLTKLNFFYYAYFERIGSLRGLGSFPISATLPLFVYLYLR